MTAPAQLGKKPATPHSELRYTGDYGYSLAGVYGDHEQAHESRRQHIAKALQEGNKRLAASFEVC